MTFNPGVIMLPHSADSLGKWHTNVTVKRFLCRVLFRYELDDCNMVTARDRLWVLDPDCCDIESFSSASDGLLLIKDGRYFNYVPTYNAKHDEIPPLENIYRFIF